MRILVIGAAGRTGRHVLDQGVARGHAITAFARDGAAPTGVAGLRAVVKGDAARAEDLRAAVREQDAVLCAVGGSAIARALIEVMPEAGVRRLVMTSSRSVTATRPRLAVGLAWLRFRAVYADLARAEGMLQASGLDWRIVRAVMLVDGPAAGAVHIDRAADATGGDWRLTRADYARTLLDVAEDDTARQSELGVGGPARGRGPARRAR
ncbi:NAD(P)-dependent oxidoreductase [Streptomonospora nanhaiensis]|uniref:Putative NADH-flavin reductase n=1 Tax=Streptomonospora nanhaiensis TaxID=1323731 RepID=A0A853BKS3_9ACTN|nr:NAD(P)-binding oxidoreductase [Streptomonospora nanhaiensis]MBV2364207.1 SDR family oxidoreductase [Streptomonospora nanhaiensis]MBX9386673.1 SDR family oxidoreductase [Streptomonospora nanhaiensis]NYI95161.1 putative NADH-flavin reductase [Streptomonospora nanhaiensis]